MNEAALARIKMLKVRRSAFSHGWQYIWHLHTKNKVEHVHCGSLISWYGVLATGRKGDESGRASSYCSRKSLQASGVDALGRACFIKRAQSGDVSNAQLPWKLLVLSLMVTNIEPLSIVLCLFGRYMQPAWHLTNDIGLLANQICRDMTRLTRGTRCRGQPLRCEGVV